MIIMADEVAFVTNRKNHGFMSLLSSAACEWLLIFLLFVEALFAYFLPKLARYCELEAPCPLCSRLDDIFVKKKPGFCWTLICRNHKREISSLMPCAIHGDLVHIEEMCEDCLMSTTMEKNPNSDQSYKLLVGKLWLDVERSALQKLMLNQHMRLTSSGLKTCSCCNKSWIPKSSAERLVEVEKSSLGVSKNNLKPPLPRMPVRSRFGRKENLKRLRDRYSGSTSPYQVSERSCADSLSHVGYTKIKFNSGSESELPFSEDDDDDDDGSVSGSSTFSKSDASVKIGKGGIPRPPGKNTAADKHARRSLKDKKSVQTSADAIQDDILRNLNPKSVNDSDDTGATSDEGSLDVSHMPSTFSVPRAAALAALSDLYPSNSTSMEGTSENVNKSASINVEAEAGSSSDVISASEPSKQNRPKSYEQDSSKVEEEKKSIEQDTVSEDKHHEYTNADHPISPELVQVPTSHLVHSALKENEQNESIKEEDSSSQAMSAKAGPKLDDEHSSHGPANTQGSSSQVSDVGGKLPKDSTSVATPDSTSPSAKRSEASHESVGDTESESEVIRLRRQVEEDRITINSLYKELDEERNASSIAANEAMVMITKLQEEKAALRTEALQYLRMMEEQAEYDMEALQRANDLLAEREKELQDFEDELEFYRSNYDDQRDETPVLEVDNSENDGEPSDLKSVNDVSTDEAVTED